MEHIVDCPGCGSPAVVVDEWHWESSEGRVLHRATVCSRDQAHNFTQPIFEDGAA